MKGIIFTEFIEMVEAKFGFEMSDKIIRSSGVSSNGAYTSVGNYSHQEIIALVQSLSNEANISIDDLLYFYGEHLFFRFSKLFPAIFEKISSAFEFLEKINSYIHVEVKKLYSDSNPPFFEISKTNEDTLIMVYHSHRGMHMVAKGLIKGCCKYYYENVNIEMELPKDSHGNVKFIITKSSSLNTVDGK